jgi:WD40 repeat protein
VAFTPDGQTLASGSTDSTVILWDAATGQQLGDGLHGHADSVNAVTFSRDGKTLASGSSDKTAILWKPLPLSSDTSASQQIYCGIVRRNLTHDEWRQYLPGEAYHKTCPAWP